MILIAAQKFESGEKFKFKMAFGHFTQLEVETAVESRLGFVRIFFRLSHAPMIAMVISS